MGFWPLKTYVEYIKNHAEGDDKFILRQPHFESIDPDNRMFLLGYYSVPLWMDTFDVSFDNEDGTFRHILHRYRSDARRYMHQVRNQLDPIIRSVTGKALLKEIRNTGRFLAIMPYWHWLKGINADARPEDFILAEEEGDRWDDATAKGIPRRDGYGQIMRDAAGRPLVGTGQGANSIVRYTPGMWGPGPGHDAGPGSQPDEVLFHELVHASREMRGVMDDLPVNAGFDDQEDYIAVVITNIYISEKQKSQANLRRDHHGYMVLQHPEKFLDNTQHIDLSPRALMENLNGSQPQFFRDLVDIGPILAPFNPVWQFDQERRRPFRNAYNAAP